MNHLSPIRIALIMAGLACTAAAGAAEMSDLSARVEALEAANAGGDWSKRINVGGLVEVEAVKMEDDSDIYTATVELDIEAEINDATTASIVLLNEDIDTANDTGLNVDEATITIHMGSTYITAGQMWLPFGRFDTYQVSDPLTLEVAETYNSALLFGFDLGGIYGDIYAFNGVSQEATEANDTVAQFGGNIGFIFEGEGFTLDVGVGYISSMAESGNISTALDDASLTPTTTKGLAELVSGTAFHANAEMGPFGFIFEQVQASDNIDAGLGLPSTAKASNVELSFQLDVAGKDATLALSTQTTEDAEWLALPEKATLATFSMQVMEATSLAIELGSAEDYSGTKSNWTGMQLAVEF